MNLQDRHVILLNFWGGQETNLLSVDREEWFRTDSFFSDHPVYCWNFLSSRENFPEHIWETFGRERLIALESLHNTVLSPFHMGQRTFWFKFNVYHLNLLIFFFLMQHSNFLNDYLDQLKWRCELSTVLIVFIFAGQFS